MSRLQHHGVGHHVLASLLTALFLCGTCLENSPSFAAEPEPATDPQPSLVALKIPDLICLWDFQDRGEGDLISRGPYRYRLTEMNGPIERATEGIFGSSSLKISRGQWLRLKRESAPALLLSGDDAVTVVAWIKREADVHWQYIAGVWNERDASRQYALFTCGHKQADSESLERTDAEHQVHGYVSDVGGATPGKPFCFSYATGKSKLAAKRWAMIAFTYDHEHLRVYFDGELDDNGGYNPFRWDRPIFEPTQNGADFTIAQRAVRTWPDYPEGQPGNEVGFGGILGGVAVYQRALNTEEMRKLYEATLGSMR